VSAAVAPICLVLGAPTQPPPPFLPLPRPPLRSVSVGVPSGTPARGGSGTGELEAPTPALRGRAAVRAECGRPRRRDGGGGRGGGGGDAGARRRVRGRRLSWHVRCERSSLRTRGLSACPRSVPSRTYRRRRHGYPPDSTVHRDARRHPPPSCRPPCPPLLSRP